MLSSQIIDLSAYKTAQLVQARIAAGTSTEEWHAHQFDAIIVPAVGAVRVWWLNRDSGERKTLVLDAESRDYLLLPRGVPHFVDLRAAKTEQFITEFLLSTETWTAEDFVKRRIHVDEPFPPVLPLD